MKLPAAPGPTRQRHLGAALLLCTILVLSAAGRASAEERILSYGSRVTVNTGGGLEVTETITVRAEGKEIKRGICRDFPTRCRDRFGNRVTVGFRVLGVLRDGKAEPWHRERAGEGERVYIGDRSVSTDATLPRRPPHSLRSSSPTPSPSKWRMPGRRRVVAHPAASD